MTEPPDAPPKAPPEEIEIPPPPRGAADYLIGFGKFLLFLVALGLGLAVLAFGACLLLVTASR
jgi:hypothetical protein